MKRKITAVLLCVALLLTLSVNVSAEEYSQIKTQNIPVTNEVTVDDGTVLAATGAIPVGYLDSVTTNAISGWAYQSDVPNTALDVRIYIINNSNGNQVVYTTKANVYRSDLYAAGYGNGYHAFHYNINWKTFVPGTYTIKAYAVGTHGAIPQLTNTKSFTVRNVEGYAEIITSTYIEGWVWKPDAPNEPLDVHAYIYRSNGQVAHIATTIANHLRTDLISAGKGNGYHGYRIYIDFDSLPEENLRVELHYVDNSGYHPAFYSGYYNNLPIHLIGMIDDEGNDLSEWATQEVINHAENIGAPVIYKCIGATKNNLINYIHSSRFAVVYTHGAQHYLGWSKKLDSNALSSGLVEDVEIENLNAGYMANVDCLLIMACSTASTEDGENNIAKSFLNKGVKSVVAFTETIKSVYDQYGDMTTEAAGYWAKIFVKELSEGSSVFSAKTVAFSELVKKQRELNNMNTSQLEIEIINRPEWVQENIYYGTHSGVILGDPNLVVQQ